MAKPIKVFFVTSDENLKVSLREWRVIGKRLRQDRDRSIPDLVHRTADIDWDMELAACLTHYHGTVRTDKYMGHPLDTLIHVVAFTGEIVPIPLDEETDD